METKNNKDMGGLVNILASVLPMAINTVGSIIKDKKAKKTTETEFIANDDNLDKGVSISSKRLMNVVGTPSLILYGVNLVSEGNTLGGVAIIALGVVYSVALAYVTHISEKSDKPII